MVDNQMLLVVLVVQAGVLLVDGGFLIHSRRIIKPRSVWWSFMLRDLMWVGLVFDQISHLYHYDLIAIDVTILLSFVITVLFTYNLIMRYLAHRSKMFLRSELLVLADKLEDMRHEDERRHGSDWRYIPQVPMRHWSKK